MAKSRKFILVLNSGSSSIKFKIFNQGFEVVAAGIMEKIGLSGSFIEFDFGAEKNKKEVNLPNHEVAMKQLFLLLKENSISLEDIAKVGHRVVHGGEEFTKPTLITGSVLNKLKKYNKLAPLHNPKNILGIEACVKLMPNVPEYAVFDTSFHATIPDFVYLYALPVSIYKKYKIRRYGFHGISHSYVALEAAKILKKKKPNLIICHLGSGCSVTAIEKGVSVDTSMGFTPLEGIMMSTRTGDLDPEIPLHLIQEGWSLEKVQNLFNKESGLVGVSGLRDMRDIMIASGYRIPGYKSPLNFTLEQKRLAKLALQMFVYDVRKYIGSYLLALGHVDSLVFTAGIGERNKNIRDLITKGLKMKSLVVPTNEELMIAKSIA